MFTSSNTTSTLTTPLTVRITNLPSPIIVSELFAYLDSTIDSAFAVDILSTRRNRLSSLYRARVQFSTPSVASETLCLSSLSHLLSPSSSPLHLLHSSDDIVPPSLRFDGVKIRFVDLVDEDKMEVAREWGGVRVRIRVSVALMEKREIREDNCRQRNRRGKGLIRIN